VVRIPGTRYYWRFAIDRGGSAVAIQGFDEGALVYALGRGLRLERPVSLAVAGEYSLFGSSEGLAFGAGRLAIGLSYTDDTAPEGEEEHGAPACCGRAAVVSWRLGESPPPVQTLTPKLGIAAGFKEEPGDPAVDASRTAITAIWSVGGNGEPPERGPATLREGFGPFGGDLHVQTLARVPNGIDEYVLTSDRRGRPIAAWLSDRRNLHVVSGTASGALHHSVRAQSWPNVGALEREHGFTADGVGDIVFWYLTPQSSGREALFIRTSTVGRAFTRPRLVAQIPGRGASAVVRAGDGGSVLAFWEWRGRREHMHLQAAFGGLDRPFSISPSLPVGSFGVEATGFVGRGEAVVIYRRGLAGYDPEGEPPFRLEAIRAQSDQSFGHPQPLFRRLRNCGINTTGELPLSEERYIPTSADGYAILHLVCEGGKEYIARYTP
jgi:hypothetical protein